MTSTLAGVLNRLPTATTTALFGGMLKCCDFVATNVPGAPVPVYTGGARVERMYAFAPTGGCGGERLADLALRHVLHRRRHRHDRGAGRGVLLDCLRHGFDEMLARTSETEPSHPADLRYREAVSSRDPTAARPTSRSRPSCARATDASAPVRRRCRDEAVAALAARRTGYLGTSHRRDGVRSVVAPHPRRARRAVRPPRRLRGAARQRRLDAVLGRGRVRPHRAAQHAPRDRRVLVEVRRGHARGAAPRRPAGVRDRAGRGAGDLPTLSTATSTRIRTTRRRPA